VTYSGISNINDLNPISVTILKFEIEIENIAFLAKNTSITIYVNGVRNPSAGVTSSGWGV
jgi:hypothetical protein